MTEADKSALRRLVGGESGKRATTDDLQGLLLQVSLALLMIFMIAYFIFVEAAKKERQEEVLAINRQKLVLALEKTAEDRRTRYGLNALMVQGTDGKRSFDPDQHISGLTLSLAPAAKTAFANGSKAALADYASASNLVCWKEEVLSAAGLSAEELTEEETEWLDGAIAENSEAVRLDARGVQRALAARLQRRWVENPSQLGESTDAGEIADLLKIKSLRLVADLTGAELLP